MKVENLIREEELKEAFELIDLFCEKLQAKLDLIEISTYFLKSKLTIFLFNY